MYSFYYNLNCTVVINLDTHVGCFTKVSSKFSGIDMISSDISTNTPCGKHNAKVLTNKDTTNGSYVNSNFPGRPLTG